MSRPPALLFALIVTAVSVVEGPHASADAHRTAATPGLRSPDARAMTIDLEKLLGPGRRLRDFAPFTTERGEPAALVLFVTDGSEPGKDMDLTGPLSCPEEVTGVGLTGTYHVALVVGGRLVNEVVIPCSDEPCDPAMHLTLPLRNVRYANSWYWGQEPSVPFDAPSANQVEPTKLVKLADFNGDGHAWEFRLVQPSACGHVSTLLAGYSPPTHRAILYPIIMGKDLDYWHDNFFPSPDHADARTVHYEFPCADHGNELQDDQRFEYNQHIEAWVMTRSDHHLCAATDHADAAPTHIGIGIGSARGRPGDTVALAVTLTGGAQVEGIELHLPVDADFQVTTCATVAPANRLNDVRPSTWGVDAMLMGVSGDPTQMTLFTCELKISPYANPGVYPLSPSGLLVSSGWVRLPATVTDGAITVESGGTPEPGGS